MAVLSETEALASLCKVVSQSSAAALLEGLPHPGFETEDFKVERQRSDVRLVASFPFYVRPLTLDLELQAALRATLSSTAALLPFTGEKLCGGFHPDYAVEWTGNEGQAHSLICFGCGEVVTAAAGSSVRSDLAGPAHVTLHRLLRKFKVNRP